MHWWARWNVRAALTLIVVAFLLGTFADIGRVRPTQENESSFLRSFNLDDIVARFDLKEGSISSEGSGSDSGYGYAAHTRAVEKFFVVRNGDHFAVEHALQQNVRGLLKATGAIVQETATPDGGRALHYVSGKTTGTVVVEPVVPRIGVPVRARVDQRKVDQVPT